jgi:GntR family transcriptional regulator
MTKRKSAPSPTFSRAIPKYFQIQNMLRERFRDQLQPGDFIPPENQLADEFGVSRITIRQSLSALVAEGLVQRGRGMRTRVTHKVREYESKKISGLLVDLMERRQGVTVEVLSMTVRDAGEEIAARLHLAPSDKVTSLERLILLDGNPLAVVEAYLPAALGAKVIREDLTRVPVIEAIRRRSGLQAHSLTEAIEAMSADVRLVQLLGVDLGAPLLKVVRVYLGADGTPIDYVKSFYRGDRYQHARTIAETSGKPARRANKSRRSG